MTTRLRAILFTIVFSGTAAAACTATTGTPLAQWFQAGRCAAFNASHLAKAPYTRNDREHLEWMHRFSAVFQPSGNPSYVYDPTHRSVFRSIGQDSYGSRTWRTIGTQPPVHVPQSDLSKIATTSGVKLGTGAAVVLQRLGKPYVVRACGLQRYVYTIDREVGGNALEFTIQNGRVVEIFQTYGD